MRRKPQFIHFLYPRFSSISSNIPCGWLNHYPIRRDVTFNFAKIMRTDKECPPPPTHTHTAPSSRRAATLGRSPRSSHDLKKYWIGEDRGRSASKIEHFGKLWSSFRSYYDVPTPNALLTRFYYDVTQIVADQRPRLVRLYNAAATTFKIILRRYTDLDDCWTTPLRLCRSYDACSTLLVRFWR